MQKLWEPGGTKLQFSKRSADNVPETGCHRATSWFDLRVELDAQHLSLVAQVAKLMVMSNAQWQCNVMIVHQIIQSEKLESFSTRLFAGSPSNSIWSKTTIVPKAKKIGHDFCENRWMGAMGVEFVAFCENTLFTEGFFSIEFYIMCINVWVSPVPAYSLAHSQTRSLVHSLTYSRTPAPSFLPILSFTPSHSFIP